MGTAMTASGLNNHMPAKDDVNATWAFLRNGIDRIMLNLRGGMDMQTYMGLYTAIHNFCTAQKASSPSVPTGTNRGGGNTPIHQIRTVSLNRKAHLLGEDLYDLMCQYLRDHLSEVQGRSTQHVDEALLTFYIKEWNRYTTAGQYHNHLFRYLNRHWVKREQEEGRRNVYDIYTLHLVKWRDEMFASTQENVMGAVLRMVEKQRNGDSIEQSHIKSIVDSFVALGLDEADSTKGTLDVYKAWFERPFLAATEEYYTAESKQFLAENSVVEYMKKAEARLQEERERVSLYLLAEITGPLMITCEKALIAAHSTALRDEFQVLLDQDRQADLARMFKLLHRIPDGLDPLRTRFEAHVRKAGLAAVDRFTEQKESVEPRAYVHALLQVHDRYQALVAYAFAGEPEFVRALDNACREYVNRNRFCRSGSSKTPELLSKYTDTLLKKTTTHMGEEDDLEKELAQVMTVFKYIEDKDVFQKFYSRMLAKRLVQTSSASDDAETSMISKLKEACGFEYTNKLQRMFQDVQISKDLNTAYRGWLDDMLDAGERKGLVETNFFVLGTGFWPLQAPTTPFTPPAALIRAYERFARFYHGKHSGRKLQWLWQLCKGELKATYGRLASSKAAPVLQVSTYQMAILLLFNDSDAVTYEEMAEVTKLNPETLDPCLGVFVKAKVLATQPADARPAPGMVYRLQTDFRPKKARINLNITVKSEQKQEVEDTHKTVEEDRKLLMQSAIVRIMKSRKKMKHQQLVSETISQIRSRFVPRVPDIKKCIDILLEKEYLERLEDDDLGYLA